MPYTAPQLKAAFSDRIAEDPSWPTQDFSIVEVRADDQKLELCILVNFEDSFTFTALSVRLDTEHPSIYESTAHWGLIDGQPPIATYGWIQYAIKPSITLEQAVQELYTLLSQRLEEIVAGMVAELPTNLSYLLACSVPYCDEVEIGEN